MLVLLALPTGQLTGHRRDGTELLAQFTLSSQQLGGYATQRRALLIERNAGTHLTGISIHQTGGCTLVAGGRAAIAQRNTVIEVSVHAFPLASG